MESMDVSDKFFKNCVPGNATLIIYLKKKARGGEFHYQTVQEAGCPFPS